MLHSLKYSNKTDRLLEGTYAVFPRVFVADGFNERSTAVLQK
jgi:hypothetical protein